MKNYFRTSKSNSTQVNLLKTFVYSTVFWLLFLVLFPSIFYWIESQIPDLIKPYKVVGGILFVLFAGINIWSAITMSKLGKGTPLPLDCASDLVIKGPYKYVRNPMAIGGIGQGIAVGIFIGSLFTIIYSLVGALLWHLYVRPIEEKDLEVRFGEEFVKYKEKVKTWIPRF